MNNILWRSRLEDLKNQLINKMDELEISYSFVDEPSPDTIIILDESDYKLYKKSLNKKIMIVSNLFSKRNNLYTYHHYDLHHPDYSIMNIIYKLELETATEKRNTHKKNIESKTKILMGFSPKGGTGVSTFCISLASKYARQGKKVLYVDLTQYQDSKVLMPTSSVNMGFCNIDFNLFDGTYELGKLKSLIERNTQVYLHKSYRFDYLSGLDFDKYSSLNHVLLNNFENVLLKLKYDVIVFDTASELSEKVIDIMFLAARIYLVADNTIGSAYKLMNMGSFFEQSPFVKKTSLVVNKSSWLMSYNAEELANQLNMDLEVKLPLARLVRGDHILYEKSARYRNKMNQLG